MKRLVLLFIAIALAVGLDAKTVYSQIGVVAKSGKFVATVDFGDGTKEGYILDEKGEKKVFNSVMEAVNYMAARDWKEVDTYVLVGNVGHLVYVMKKEVKEDSEIRSDIKTKDV